MYKRSRHLSVVRLVMPPAAPMYTTFGLSSHFSSRASIRTEGFRPLKWPPGLVVRKLTDCSSFRTTKYTPGSSGTFRHDFCNSDMGMPPSKPNSGSLLMFSKSIDNQISLARLLNFLTAGSNSLNPHNRSLSLRRHSRTSMLDELTIPLALTGRASHCSCVLDTPSGYSSARSPGSRETRPNRRS